MKTINWLLLTLLFTVIWNEAYSQININIQVKPPYQSRIAEYASRPDLILLTLTNTSRETQRVQLTGSIVGNNDISLTVRPSYKSPSPIEIAPGQVIALNSTDISFLFNYSSINVKGIDLNNVVYDARLREGIYQICIRALDYDTRQPISPDEPMGCTMFYINDLEPPIITAPLTETVLQNTGMSPIFPITWLSSPGSVPSTQYKVKIVEIIANRDPNDAMQSATTPPFFERTIMGGNSLLYGPTEPQLTPGRKYALMVQAIDPSGQSIFRNEGKSEVHVFEYGNVNSGIGSIADGSGGENNKLITKENATNTISGKVIWAYKATEESFKSAPTTKIVYEPKDESSKSSGDGLVGYYLSHNDLQMKNYTALIMADPTLQQSSDANTSTNSASIYSPGTTSTDYFYHSTNSREGTTKFPLSNTTVNLLIRRKLNRNTPKPNESNKNNYNTIFGERNKSSLTSMLSSKTQTSNISMSSLNEPTSPNPQNAPVQEYQNDLLATATTNQSGVFTLELINPKFEGVMDNAELVISIKKEGFDAFEKALPANELDRLENIDIGELLVLANTYRFNPKIELERPQNTEITNPGMRIKVYREATDENKYPFLKEEGNRFQGTTTTKVINGKLYNEIATDSVAKDSYSVEAYSFNFGRIFRFGKIYIEAEDLSQNYKKLTTNLQVVEFKSNTDNRDLLTVKPSYLMKVENPSVIGEVLLSAGENKVPVAGAMVRVSFNKEDVTLSSSQKADNIQASTSPPGSLFSTEKIAITSVTSTSGTVKLASSSDVSFSSISAAVSNTGLSVPAEITSASGSALTYNVVNSGALSSNFAGLYLKYTAFTDSAGNFLIGDLPVLKPGGRYTIELINVPSNYQGMAVLPDSKQTFAVNAGSQTAVQFNISPELVNIVGRVVTEKETPVGFARLHFKGSTHYFESGETGIFQTSFYVGEHTLIVEKEGYMPFEKIIRVTGKEETDDRITATNNIRLTPVLIKPGEAVMSISTPDTWMKSTQQTPTVQSAINSGQKFSPTLFGHTSSGNARFASHDENTAPFEDYLANNGPSASFSVRQANDIFQYTSSISEFSSIIGATFRLNENSYVQTNTQDLGDIGPMLPRIGKVKFTILEQGTSTPVEGASIALFDTLNVTDRNGQWLYEGFGGQVVVTVKPPAGKRLVAVQKSININDNGLVEEVNISLQTGVRVFGSVTGKNQPIPEAQISVEGFEYLSVSADQSGVYEMYIPPGAQVLKASKTGFFSKREERTLSTTADIEWNFSLEDGGGRNISTLLGFEIELDKSEKDGQTEKWSGRFVNLKPVSTFFTTDTKGIAFNNIKVTFDANGNAIPENNKVITDVTQIPLKVFGFLPIILKNDSKIVVEAMPDGKGSIKGKMQLDVSRVLSSSIKLPVEIPIFTKIKNTIASGEASTSSPDQLDIELFRAGATNELPDLTLQLVTENNKKVSLDLYGFTVNLDLTKSSVATTGIVLSGNVKTPALGPISSADIVIEELSLSDKFSLKSVKISETGLPEIKIANWSAKLSSVLFNENGFKLGGELKFSIPSSGDSQLDFADLSLAKDAIFGGKFSFPGAGLNLVKVANLKSAGKPLSFGRVGSTQVYYLSGSAKLKFEKLISDEITIPSFQVQTDARFMLEAPVNLKVSVGFASIEIQSITVSTLQGSTPFIGVKGKFGVALPMLKIETGDIKYTAGANGQVNVSVGTLTGVLDIPVMKVGVTIGLKENGFEGGGKLGIPGTPINADIKFHYFKLPNGIDVGAEFSSGVIIPLGVVQISRVGGGFRYNSDNRTFMININGAASITGLQAVVKLDPISLTVETGPVVKGKLGVVVGEVLALADAEVVLDFPAKQFNIKINMELEPLPKVAKARVQGLLGISWKPEDTYVFLGTSIEVDVLGILKSRGVFAIGINVRDPKSRGDAIPQYFSSVDDALLAEGAGTVFSGVYLHGKTTVGIREKDAPRFSFGLVSGRAWFYTETEVMLFLNFAQNQYAMLIGGMVEVGAEGCFTAICVGAQFASCFRIAGSLNSSGWELSGNVAGYLAANVGNCMPKCNDFCIGVFKLGGRLCIGAHASLRISSSRGIDAGFGLGADNNGNKCM